MFSERWYIIPMTGKIRRKPKKGPKVKLTINKDREASPMKEINLNVTQEMLVQRKIQIKDG